MPFLKALLLGLAKDLFLWAYRGIGKWWSGKKKKDKRHDKMDKLVERVEVLRKEIIGIAKQGKQVPDELLKEFDDASNELNSFR